MVHRRDSLRATKIYHEPLMQAKNLEFRWDSQVMELLHDGRLTGVKIRNLRTGAEEVLPCDGLFVSIGRIPATDLVAGQLALDEQGYVDANENCETNIPGVYAVGDVRAKAVRQIVTAVADGAVAVHHAESYLSQKD